MNEKPLTFIYLNGIHEIMENVSSIHNEKIVYNSICMRIQTNLQFLTIPTSIFL